MAHIFNRLIIFFTIASFSLTAGCCQISLQKAKIQTVNWSLFCCDLKGNPISGALVMYEIKPSSAKEFYTYHPVFYANLVTSREGVASKTMFLKKTDAISIRIIKDGYQGFVLPYISVDNIPESGLRQSVVLLTTAQAIALGKKGTSRGLDHFFKNIESIEGVYPGRQNPLSGGGGGSVGVGP